MPTLGISTLNDNRVNKCGSSLQFYLNMKKVKKKVGNIVFYWCVLKYISNMVGFLLLFFKVEPGY